MRFAVARGWAGLECLSGIPGLVGATPIQNVGAYGQEVSETVVAVRALDTHDGEVAMLSPAECRFTYRDSVFKSGEPGRWIVLDVRYRLRPGGAATVRYAEVERHLAARGIAAPSLGDVRESVLAIRRSKSMVLDPDDPNRRSCGSFFVNPVVTVEEADRLAALGMEPPLPRWPQPDGRVKLSAAWLIERAGFARGYRAGVGRALHAPRAGHRGARRRPRARRPVVRAASSRRPCARASGSRSSRSRSSGGHPHDSDCGPRIRDARRYWRDAGRSGGP